MNLLSHLKSWWSRWPDRTLVSLETKNTDLSTSYVFGISNVAWLVPWNVNVFPWCWVASVRITSRPGIPRGPGKPRSPIFPLIGGKKKCGCSQWWGVNLGFNTHVSSQGTLILKKLISTEFNISRNPCCASTRMEGNCHVLIRALTHACWKLSMLSGRFNSPLVLRRRFLPVVPCHQGNPVTNDERTDIFFVSE